MSVMPGAILRLLIPQQLKAVAGLQRVEHIRVMAAVMAVLKAVLEPEGVLAGMLAMEALPGSMKARLEVLALAAEQVAGLAGIGMTA